MTSPSVTVLMPVYNGERFLRPAIDSVLSQDFRDFELMIVDDGSTDSTVDIVHSYRDARIRLLHNPRNLGIVGAMQAGLHTAQGEFIARLDADDVCYPYRLARQVAYLKEHDDVVLLGGACDIIDAEDRLVGVYCGPTSPLLVEWDLLFRDPIVHPTVMFRRDKILSINGYRTGFPHAEDYDLWSRVAATGGTIAQLPTPLIRLRKHASQISETYRATMAETTNRIVRANIKMILGRNAAPEVAACLAGHPPATLDRSTLFAAYDTLAECWTRFAMNKTNSRADIRRLFNAMLPHLMQLARQDERYRLQALRCALRHVLRYVPEAALTPSFLRFVGRTIAPRSVRRAVNRITGRSPLTLGL